MYDLIVALADLVDNSITALNNSNKSYKFIEICNNDISTSFPNLEWLSIVDNGIGMSENELINAFRLGGEGVDKDRGDKDLGRFGLGLKTASFSQCKKLTVISKKVDNEICALVFDLDAIEVSENWEVQRLSSEKQEYFFSAILERLENKDILNQESWTIVIWEKFDKLQISIKQSFYSELEKVRKHFSLVFHKFNGEINIFSNRTKIEYWDPFSYGVSDQKKLLFVGTDSHSFGNYWLFATVICCYAPGNGGRFFTKRKRIPKEQIKTLIDRLLHEAHLSIEAAQEAGRRALALRGTGRWSGDMLADIGDQAADGYLQGLVRGARPVARWGVRAPLVLSGHAASLTPY